MTNELLSPPRRMPLNVKAKCIFMGSRYQISFLFLGVSTVFFLVFAFDYPSVLFYKSTVETTTGTLVDKKKTVFSTGRINFGGLTRPGENIYKYFYIYRVMGKSYEASSVGIDRQVDKQTTLVVEYLKNRPSISRIQGMSPGLHLSGRVTPLVIIIVIILIAFSAVYSMTRKRVYLYRLLRIGQTAIGTVKTKNILSRSSGREWYEVVYEFVVEGCAYQVIDRPYYTEQIEIGEQRTLLYDPKNPHKAALLDNIPCSIVLDESGQISSGSLLSTITISLIPIASTTLMIVSLYFEFSK
jgi:Protein of unknown function (DUF3592)